jgi:hypothetical protein
MGIFRRIKYKCKRKENDKEIIDRVVSLAENVDCGLMPPPMDAQVAINELCRYILGEDWYVVNPISTKQCNTEIVAAIELKLKNLL